MKLQMYRSREFVSLHSNKAVAMLDTYIYCTLFSIFACRYTEKKEYIKNYYIKYMFFIKTCFFTGYTKCNFSKNTVYVKQLVWMMWSVCGQY